MAGGDELFTDEELDALEHAADPSAELVDVARAFRRELPRTTREVRWGVWWPRVRQAYLAARGVLPGGRKAFLWDVRREAEPQARALHEETGLPMSRCRIRIVLADPLRDAVWVYAVLNDARPRDRGDYYREYDARRRANDPQWQERRREAVRACRQRQRESEGQ